LKYPKINTLAFESENNNIPLINLESMIHVSVKIFNGYFVVGVEKRDKLLEVN